MSEERDALMLSHHPARFVDQGGDRETRQGFAGICGRLLYECLVRVGHPEIHPLVAWALRRWVVACHVPSSLVESNVRQITVQYAGPPYSGQS